MSWLTKSKIVRPTFSGWYGKLPGAGDFIGRGLPHEVQSTLDYWFQQGLVQIRHQKPDAHIDFSGVPIWSFIAGAQSIADVPVLGCVAASYDSVNRNFPLILCKALSGDIAQNLPPYNRWHAVMHELILDGLHECMDANIFDQEFSTLNSKNAVANVTHEQLSANADILEVLGKQLGALPACAHTQSVFPWTEVVEQFHPETKVSYWWTLTGGVDALRLQHVGALSPGLFMRLFT